MGAADYVPVCFLRKLEGVPELGVEECCLRPGCVDKTLNFGDYVAFLQISNAPGSALELASPICVASESPLCSSGHYHMQLLMGTVSSAAEGTHQQLHMVMATEARGRLDARRMGLTR